MLRVEGAGTRALLSGAWPKLARGTPPCFARVRLRGAQGTLDDALVMIESEAAVELCLHGSVAIVAAVRQALGDLGICPGIPGSGSGYRDRCREALAEAATLPAARMLLDQAEGALDRELAEWVEVGAGEILDRVAELRRRARVATRLLCPSRVVLAGPVNAGKSTLFNALVGRERAVVSGEAGTTRDAVGERVRWGAYPVELFDAAGERAEAGEDRSADLERAGQRRALELQGVADLVLRLDPRGRGERSSAARTSAGVPQVEFRSLDDGARDPEFGLSALGRPAEAVARIESAFHRVLDLPLDPWVPGQGVPVEPTLMARIESWAAEPPGEPRANALDRLLGPLDPG